MTIKGKHMINFNEDENLGQVIESKLLFSFGAAPIKSFREIVFAAGGNKFSSLCGFKFISKAENEHKEFFIAFVCKLRSKIYHTAVSNPSQWFIFKKISPLEMHCLDKKSLLLQYGFDIDKFFKSDYFLKTIPKFKAAIKKGLEEYVPEYVKAHGNELAKDNLTSYDGQLNATIKDAIGRYVSAISDSIQYIDDTLVNNKFYELVSYDLTVESLQLTSQWHKMHDKWSLVRQSGDLVKEIEAIIPDMLKNMYDTFKYQFKPYLFENAIEYVLDDDALWKDSITPEKFIKNVIDVLFSDKSELSIKEDKIVEAGKWECYVKDEGDGKFGVYEKNGDFWTATFSNKIAAEEFAKSYPQMKSRYIVLEKNKNGLVEADDREPLSHGLDIVGVKASTANTSAQDELEMSIVDKEIDDDIEEEMKKIYS